MNTTKQRNWDYIADLYLSGSPAIQMEAVDILKDHYLKELNEAILHFGDNSDDMTDFELLTEYRKSLRREMNQGDMDINLSNEQVT